MSQQIKWDTILFTVLLSQITVSGLALVVNRISATENTKHTVVLSLTEHAAIQRISLSS